VAPLLGAPGARGPGSLNRLNPRLLRHCILSFQCFWLRCLGDRKGIQPVRNWVLVCWWW